jgi:hypothetical protein
MPTPAVVFVSYGPVPEERLRDHFRWNDAVYRAHGVRVYVVSDVPRPWLPDYAEALVYPRRMPIFNLAKTKNYGIRTAIERDGCSTVIATDVDIAFPSDVFADLVAVGVRSAAVPIYRMASSYETRDVEWVDAPKATGTVAMDALDWWRVHYHEGCEGYGCDDGILLAGIHADGIAVVRDGHVDHIAHVAGTPQREFDRATPRTDHWGRASGFNPENFRRNRRFHKPQNAYVDPEWGTGK